MMKFTVFLWNNGVLTKFKKGTRNFDKCQGTKNELVSDELKVYHNIVHEHSVALVFTTYSPLSPFIMQHLKINNTGYLLYLLTELSPS
jgi:hypothetical protein